MTIPFSPPESRNDLRIQAILDAAEKAFSELGFSETTLECIAEAAGLSLPSVQRWFETKDDVVAALIERYVDHTHTVIEDTIAAASNESSVAVVRSVFRNLAEAWMRVPALATIAAGTFSLQEQSPVKPLRLTIIKYTEAMLRMRVPGIPADECRITASTVANMFEAGLLNILQNHRLNPDDLIEESAYAVAA